MGSLSFDAAEVLETRLDSGRHVAMPSYQHTDHTHSHRSRTLRSMSPEIHGKSLTRRNYNRLERELVVKPVNPFLTAHQWEVPISRQDMNTSDHQPFTQQDMTTQQHLATPTNHTHHTSSHLKRSGHVTSSGGTSHTHQRHGSKKNRARHVLSNESIFQDFSQQDTPTFQEEAEGVGCHRQQLSLDDTHYYNTRESLLSGMSHINGRGTSYVTTSTLSKEPEVSH